jgi:hypothetical protein
VADYPLKTLLGLRRREEEAAEQAWAKAQRARREAEVEEERRAKAVRVLEERLEAAQVQTAGSLSASEVTAMVRFQARVRDELARATALRETYRRGHLATACAEEERARQDVLDRRRAREALETHEERFREGQQREADRRADDDNDENARIGRHVRRPDSDPGG